MKTEMMKSNRSLLSITSVLIFLLLSVVSTVHAATYYVSPTGSDSNAGTAAAPFLTIGHTCSYFLNPGDTVILKDGVYTLNSGDACDIRGSGTSSAWITFEAEHKWGAKLNGNNNSAAYGFTLSANAYIRVKNFEIYGFSGAGIIVENEPSTSPNSNIEISGNNIHDIGRVCSDSPYGGSGIFVGTYSSSIVVSKNMIHDIGRYAAGENGCAPATSYYMNHDHGVYLDGVNGLTLVNNIFYNNNRGWDIQFYNGSGTPTTSNVLVANNTFASQNPYEVGQIILAYPGVASTTIENNIFNLPPTAGVWVYTGGSPIFSTVNVSNNIVNSGAINSGISTGISFTSNSANTNPSLVNSSLYDFHLQAASSAINAGVAVPSVTDDFAGNARPSGSVYDIGALEYTGPAFYGAGLGVDSISYTTIGGSSAQAVSDRFLSTHTGLLSSITWYQAVNSSAYAHGTNGQIQAQVETDDGTALHNPSGKVLASAVVSSLCGTTVTGCAVTLVFTTPASLTSGTLYHVVYTNVDSTPAVNYSSISALYSPSVDQPSLSGTNWGQLMYTASAGWKQLTGLAPIIQFNFSDGTVAGKAYVLPYTQWIQSVSGTNSVREQFTVSTASQQINSASFRLGLLSGSDPLTVTLEQADGTVIEQGTIPASAIPSSIVYNSFTASNWAAPQWATYTFTSTHILSVGQTYYLVLSAPSSSVYNIYPVQKGGVSGFSPATDFPDGFAQFNSGSGWVSGPLTSNSSDLQFYLTMRPVIAGTYSLNASTTGSGYGMVFGSNSLINCGVNAGATLCGATVFSGTSVTLTATPANGSNFTGWTISGSSTGTCTGKTSPCTLTVNANTTVAANFGVQTETITASAGSGGTISPSGAVNLNYGASQTFTVASNAGYTPVLTVDGSPVTLTNNTYTFSNVTTAHTIAVSFSQQAAIVTTEAIAVSAGSGGTINPSGSLSVNYGSNQTFTVTPNTGYTVTLKVDGTAVSLTNNTYTLTNVTAAHTVAASFSLQNVTLTASAGSGGTISPSGTGTVSYGSSQLFTLTPQSGYSATLKVDGIAVTLTNNTYNLTNITATHALVASFTPLPTVTLTASAGSGGSISPSGTGTVSYGSSLMFTLTPKSGYSATLKVDGNTVTLSNNSFNLTNITTTHVLVASFSPVVTKRAQH